MKSRFQDLVYEVSHPRRVPKVATGGLFVGLSTESHIWGQKNNQFKPDGDDQAWQAELPAAPELSVDKDEILEELNLSGDLTIAELKAIRRAFARENHPDTGSGKSAARENRMKIANMIIDEQIQLRSRG